MNIAVLFISLSISSDNFILSGVGENTNRWIRTDKSNIIMFLLFTIQLQILMYGLWLAVRVNQNMNNSDKWISIGLLTSMAINMIQEIKKCSQKQ